MRWRCVERREDTSEKRDRHKKDTDCTEDEVGKEKCSRDGVVICSADEDKAKSNSNRQHDKTKTMEGEEDEIYDSRIERWLPLL